MLTYVKPEYISLKADPNLDEKWVQGLIAADPAILGLGPLVLRDSERYQPKAGRLDLLLQDRDSKQRFEVEVQLGATDETHIVRTLEYWDIERKRYPQYEHTAVLIAEDVTSRFLNVISLFNDSVPLIAIKMQAIKVEDKISLIFTTVLDLVKRGFDEEEEDALVVTDREYWVKGSDAATLKLADEVLEMAQTFNGSLALKYNKFYIGVTRDGKAFNFVEMVPRKKWCEVRFKLPYSEEREQELSAAGLDLLSYDTQWNQFRIRLTTADLKKHQDLLKSMLLEAYELRSS